MKNILFILSLMWSAVTTAAQPIPLVNPIGNTVAGSMELITPEAMQRGDIQKARIPNGTLAVIIDRKDSQTMIGIMYQVQLLSGPRNGEFIWVSEEMLAN